MSLVVFGLSVDNFVDKAWLAGMKTTMRERWFWGSGVALMLGLAVAGVYTGSLAWTDRPFPATVKAVLYYESWLMPWLLAALLRLWRQGRISGVFAGAAGLLLLIGVYARFVEPNLLLERHTAIHTGYRLKLALVSDLHYGQFSTDFQQRQLVSRLNALDVDAVLVAGDWTYDPPRNVALETLLASFRQIRHPVYSVPGNHDEQQPGPPLQQALKAALIHNGVMPVEGRSVTLGPVRLVGLNELWSCLNGSGLPRDFQPDNRPVLLLGHHPEAADGLPPLPEGSLLLAGHTHGGQVNLPFLTDWVLQNGHFSTFRQGLYRKGHLQVFVTSGVGMIGLPLRFAVPPVIDVLELY